MSHLNFPLDPQGYWHSPGFRGLTYKEAWKGTDLVHKGWDVFALQTALNAFADPAIELDGVFGERTLTAVKRFQKNRGLLVDGVAGNATQFTLIRHLAPDITAANSLPKNGLKGIVEKESGNYLGNHTKQYGQETETKADDSWDLGVCQINDIHKGLPWEKCFDVPFALDFIGETIKAAYDKYSKSDPERLNRLKARGVSSSLLSEQRRWELAFGSWNRPSHTAWLAGQPKGETQEGVPGGKPLTPEQREWIEGYISRVTVYITDWTP